MRRSAFFGLSLLALTATSAAAGPVTFGTVPVTTTGTFFCMDDPACVASGNSVTLSSGGMWSTLTFSGVSTSVAVSNFVVPFSLGSLSATGSDSTFVTRKNPTQPIVGFRLTLNQAGTTPQSQTMGLLFGPGGGTDLAFQQGSTYFRLAPPDGVPAGYNLMVYTLTPDEFAIPMNGSVDLTVNAGVVPEPATWLLLGTGLGLVWKKARQRVRLPR